jgi:hypothetical protein
MGVSLVITVPHAIILASDSRARFTVEQPNVSGTPAYSDGAERIITHGDMALSYVIDDVLGGTPTAQVLRELLEKYCAIDSIESIAQTIAKEIGARYPLTRLILYVCSYRGSLQQCYQIIFKGAAGEHTVTRIHKTEDIEQCAMTWSGDGEIITRLMLPLDINGTKQTLPINFQTMSAIDAVRFAHTCIQTTIDIASIIPHRTETGGDSCVCMLRPDGIVWKRGPWT